jgi:phosphate starvation-inducible PhoH-like protein
MRISKILRILTPMLLIARPSCSFFSNVGFNNIRSIRGISSSSLFMRAKKTPTLEGLQDSSAVSRSRKTAPVYLPKSENQKLYVEHLKNSSIPIVLGIGPAGCGKTLFACINAIDMLRSGAIDKIILTRPIVPVEEEEIGFLPGNLIHKMDPWTRPIFDIFLEFYSQRDLDSMLASGVIEISPLAFMRGRTFKRAFIVADEMQNSSPGQMLMLTTRIGDKTKMVITGDLKQSDRSLNNGLLDIMKKIREHRLVDPDLAIRMVEMGAMDIERSPIVAKILSMYSESSRVASRTGLDNQNQSIKHNIENLGIHKKDEFYDGNADIIRPNYQHPDNNKKRQFNGSDGDAAMMPISHLSSRF